MPVTLLQCSQCGTAFKESDPNWFQNKGRQWIHLCNAPSAKLPLADLLDSAVDNSTQTVGTRVKSDPKSANALKSALAKKLARRGQESQIESDFQYLLEERLFRDPSPHHNPIASISPILDEFAHTVSDKSKDFKERFYETANIFKENLPLALASPHLKYHFFGSGIL